MRFELIKLDRDFNPNNVVTNHEPIDKKSNRNKFTNDGIFSEIIFGKMPSTGRDYSCECGETHGKFLNQLICNECGTKVIDRSAIFDKKGWIDLGGYYVINPLFYYYFTKILTAKTLENILQKGYFLDTGGEMIDNSLLTEETEGKKKTAKSNKSKYYNIGIIEFMNNWKEIVAHHINMSDIKAIKYLNLLYAHEDKIFVSHLPIFSIILRPALVVGDKVIFNEINSTFNIIIRTVNLLKNQTNEETTIYSVEASLNKIQKHINYAFQYIIKTLNGKKGHIRNTILGTRINFSCRSVITPLPTGYLHDEIIIPYLGFLELYKFHIINILTKDHNMSMREANNTWHLAQSNKIKAVNMAIEKLLRKKNYDGTTGQFCLLNRNPTIAFGSILRCRIINVKDGKTISICNSSTKFMNADYDGDVLSVIPLLDDDLAKAFESFNPRNMIISRDGLFTNKLAKMSKDHVLGISILTEDIPSM